MDSRKNMASYTRFDAIWTVLVICASVADLVTDCQNIIAHCVAGNIWCAGLMAATVVVPGIAMAVVNERQYAKDRKNELSPMEKRWRGIQIACSLLFLSPVTRNAEKLIYGLKLEEAKKKNDPQSVTYAKKYRAACNILVFLTLIEGLLESAPQLVLQFYLVQPDFPGPSWLSAWIPPKFSDVVTSLQVVFHSFPTILMGLNLEKVNFLLRSLEDVTPEGSRGNERLPPTLWWGGSFHQMAFLANFSFILMRVFILSAFAFRTTGWHGIIVYVVHSICMALWVWRSLRKILPSMMLGFCYYFAMFDAYPTNSRWRYLIYHLVCATENIVMFTVGFTINSGYGYLDGTTVVFAFAQVVITCININFFVYHYHKLPATRENFIDFSHID